jgi:hypothetical protein
MPHSFTMPCILLVETAGATVAIVVSNVRLVVGENVVGCEVVVAAMVDDDESMTLDLGSAAAVREEPQLASPATTTTMSAQMHGARLKAQVRKDLSLITWTYRVRIAETLGATLLIARALVWTATGRTPSASVSNVTVGRRELRDFTLAATTD